MNKAGFDPDWVVHPGEVLSEALEERGLKQRDFAKRVGVSEQLISMISRGRRLYSAKLAIAFERELDIPATLWMNLKTNYELGLARGKKRVK